MHLLLSPRGFGSALDHGRRRPAKRFLDRNVLPSSSISTDLAGWWFLRHGRLDLFLRFVDCRTDDRPRHFRQSQHYHIRQFSQDMVLLSAYNLVIALHLVVSSIFVHRDRRFSSFIIFFSRKSLINTAC